MALDDISINIKFFDITKKINIGGKHSHCQPSAVELKALRYSVVKLRKQSTKNVAV